ncbi:adenosylcobinamide-phosphate synthase CbiB [Cognatishimia sp. SS12]|uniref:adenosylcobinamide-phosphate synthase CbiB n=1 Tax=Cognatishimia sp. SS12 TaxID=2979465 RepID=UPI00232F166C|nr:adenosylcobinamide-phosphate synthase CbiB [Cognatishimia sp. SS12]MDC0739247.1 adenosylcobinamide-phosphate synthase CbiB [Cognatishimia sp. SS12]
MDTATLLFCALLLDAAFGEPKWLWDRVSHPAVLIGKLISWADDTFNTGDAKRNGVLLVLALLVGTWLIGGVIEAIGWLAELLVVAILLAQRALVDHVKDVASALRNSLAEGRIAVAKIVGRDTAEMDGPAVSRAAIESGAENLSDGVIAPAFWFLIFGLPGILAYKAINTADSMIGYRTPRHEDFGWAAAKLDDLLNWLPARLTALLIAATHSRLKDWAHISDDARLHRSPNAGWPEAAMAISLNVALSGPRSYEGEMRDFPYVNPEGAQDIGPNAIDQAAAALWRVWAVALAVTAALALL